MSAHCGHEHGAAPTDDPAYRRILWLVLVINGAMFAVEAGAGLLAGSVALQADALDFLGDAATYALSLMVLGMSLRWRASAAVLKGATMGLFGLWVIGNTILHAVTGGIPSASTMGVIGTLALIANVVSALVLFGYRNGDSNRRSVWLCTRNDAIGNVAVVGAGGLVYLLQSGWPDLVVGGAMGALALHSAYAVLTHARDELRSLETVSAGD